MGENDWSVGRVRSVLLSIDDLLVVGVDLFRCDGIGSGTSLPIGTVITPNDIGHVHSLGNDSDSVIDITERRSPAFRSDAQDILDDLSGVV